MNLVSQHCYITQDENRNRYYWDAALSANRNALEALVKNYYMRHYTQRVNGYGQLYEFTDKEWPE